MDMLLKIMIIGVYCIASALVVRYFWSVYCRWYSYNLYKRAYLYYKWYINKHNYTYESYRDDFICGHETLTLQGERRIRLHSLLKLLQHGKPLIEKYFEKEYFEKKDYKILIAEWRRYSVTQTNLQKSTEINSKNNDHFSVTKTTLEENRVLCDVIKGISNNEKDDLWKKIQEGVSTTRNKGQYFGLLYIILQETKLMPSPEEVNITEYNRIIRNTFPEIEFHINCIYNHIIENCLTQRCKKRLVNMRQILIAK
jgi:hypothetical protein